MRILLDNITVIGTDSVIPQGQIIIQDDIIEYVGAKQTIKSSDFFDMKISDSSLVAMAGLVNAHTHAGMTLTRGFADDKPLMTWLHDHIWPLEQKLTADDIYWGTMLAALEMIKTGTVAFADMYFEMDQVAQVVLESGMKASLGWGLICFDDTANQKIDKAVDFALNWRDKGEGRIKTMLTPHAPYTCPPPYIEKIQAKAAINNIPLHIHLAETEDEIKTIAQQYNCTPFEWAEQYKLLTDTTIAAHCVHATANDLNLLAKYQVNVAHNPQSNMKLASGAARISEMWERGINICLGTDGAGSNNSLDMFKEMKTAALLAKHSAKVADTMSANDVLKMATQNGAQGLGFGEESGQLKAGFKADIVLLNFDQPHLKPLYHPKNHLVYSCSGHDVETVFVNGKLLYHHGEFLTLDVEKILYNVEKISKRFS